MPPLPGAAEGGAEGYMSSGMEKAPFPVRGLVATALYLAAQRTPSSEEFDLTGRETY